MPETSHVWKFIRAGGFDQVLIDRGADLAALDQLDQKLWVALSCPTQGLEFNTRTLELIDTDHDGRIRAPEIIAAARWAVERVRHPDELLKASPGLPLSAIDDSTPEGRQVLTSAKHVLTTLGRGDASSISAEDTLDTATRLAQTPFNGDGIVPASAAEDPGVRAAIADIIACVGGETDRNGEPGISQEKLDRFFTEARAYVDWWELAGQDTATVLPLGEKTADAAATFEQLRPRVEDYFTRCRLAAFDARSTSALNGQESDYLGIAAKTLDSASPEMARLPLARIEAGRPLPLTDGVNPAWAEPISRLRTEVILPLLGDASTLTEAGWDTLRGRFAPYRAWHDSQPGSAVAGLGLAHLRELLDGQSRAAIEALIARDKALEPELNAIAAVEKLVLLHRDLYKLVNNFVSFRTFYGRREKAVFQAGTLYLDQRSCELCLRVDNIDSHASLAGLARTFLAYCECKRKASGEKMTIAAAFTDGDADDLMVGRNGIFYDRQGRDWDATIVRILEHPISIRQAFWAPYKKVASMIESQLEKMAASREKATSDAAAARIEAGGKKLEAAEEADVAKKEAFDVAKFAGIFAAIGLAVGALGSIAVSVVSGILSLSWWQIPLALAGILLIISAPSMVMAWLKLRRRSLAPLLDAGGWAVNARARINIPFGGSLTGLPRLPEGAHRDLADPFEESHRTRDRLIALAVLAAAIAGLWYFGVLNRFMPWLPASSFVEQPAPAPAE